MFKIIEEPTFRHDVVARVPVDGGYTEEKFAATFRVISPEEIDSFDLMKTEGATDFLKRVVVELHDIADAQGKALEWSDATRDAALRLPWARGALSRTYFEAIQGAKRGN